MTLLRSLAAAAWLIWGVLHIWVGGAGFGWWFKGAKAQREDNNHGDNGAKPQWDGVIGGRKVPHDTFQHANDPATTFAHRQLILNFTNDVGGYGVLGVFVAYAVFTSSPADHFAYWVGVVIIGIADLSFLFILVTPGVIKSSFEVVLGPLIWVVAVVLTPFALDW
ncbi:Aste57867_22058 [Aphanomyces stellatus]|uniref:Aste57867_22058 protein n=1 Tax=Aphanomyces stellatus TaxID=120398 RepID=A0A485LKI9_9STRA|nr:hypothetical protein As57867_021989 [Aphanomyces stellatus]VFT98726.1 Aste57867_22058 [Aphanomyces stellatus]